MRRAVGLLGAVVAFAGLGCGGRVSFDNDAHGSVDAAPSVTLTIPLGSYTNCSSSQLTVAPKFEGVAGGDGTITLAQVGDGVVATLAFDQFADGALAFTPTSSTTAAFAPSQPHDVELYAFHDPLPSGSKVSLTPSAASLALVGGDTLFVSVYAKRTDSAVSGYFRCTVPASLPVTNVVAKAVAPAPVTAGVYGPCTSNLDSGASGSLSGGTGEVTVAASAGELLTTWKDDVTSVCKGLDFAASSELATLGAGQSCEVHEPCGPPPTLGTSPFPDDAVLTNLTGSMTLDAHALFIHVVGDAPTEACGRHYLSILCAPPEN